MRFKIGNLNCELIDFKKKTLILCVNAIEIGTIHKNQKCLRENNLTGIQTLVKLRLRNFLRDTELRVDSIPTIMINLNKELEVKKKWLEELKNG